MTTIAYKDGVIAYDSQVTRGDVITYDDYEKCLEQGGVKFFCSGAVSDFQRLVDVYFGAKAEGNIDVTALVFDGDSLMMVAVDDATGLWKSPIMRDRPYAIGSGSPFAFAAMDMGATAEQAVAAAARRDTSTGRQIRLHEIGGGASNGSTSSTSLPK